MQQDSVVRVGLIVAIVVLMGVVGFLSLRLVPLLATVDAAPQATAPARPGLVTSTTPLVEAATLAEARAKAWSEDATLVRAEGSWVASAGWQQVAHPPVAWSFTYYAPSRGQLASASVRDETVLWVQPRAIPIVPATLSAFPPAYSVDAAWISFLAAEGDELLKAHPGLVVHFVLQPNDGAATWTVSARQDETLVQVTMDAQAGTVRVP